MTKIKGSLAFIRTSGIVIPSETRNPCDVGLVNGDFHKELSQHSGFHEPNAQRIQSMLKIYADHILPPLSPLTAIHI